MVHRKSTYKLAFKNLSKDIRKSIWEENSILREKRRTIELSHHSIEECDDSCECDSDYSTDEEYEQDSHDDARGSDEEEDQEEDIKGRHSNNKEEDDDEDDDDRDKSLTEKNEQRQNRYINGCCKNKKSYETAHHRPQSCTQKDKDKRHLKKLKEETSVRKLKRPELKKVTSRREISLPGKKYCSETELNDLLKSLSTKRRRGVLKCSKTTGEFDLIPARLQLVKKDSKESVPSKSQPTRHLSPSYDKTIINIRPRTALRSMSRPASCQGRPFSSGSEREKVTFSDDAAVRKGSKLELRSVRKEPRMGSLSRENVLVGTKSLCQRCGQEIRHRGITT